MIIILRREDLKNMADQSDILNLHNYKISKELMAKADLILYFGEGDRKYIIKSRNDNTTGRKVTYSSDLNSFVTSVSKEK